LVNCAVDGGKYVTTVAGAVPNDIPVVGVPPEILSFGANAPPGSTHVVVNVIIVPPALTLAAMSIY
jgi:hypothetical protein